MIEPLPKGLKGAVCDRMGATFRSPCHHTAHNCANYALKGIGHYITSVLAYKPCPDTGLWWLITKATVTTTTPMPRRRG